MVKEKQVGKITHYYSDIGAAVVEVGSIIKKGDKLKIGKSHFFEQKVGSMELGHEKIEAARKGLEIGLKVEEKTRVGDLVYKI